MKSAFYNVIEEKWLEKRAKYPGYSLRRFARQLEVSPSALSEILKGKRKVSLKRAIKILERLSLSPETHDQILQEFSHDTRIRHKKSKIAYTELSEDEYSLLHDWYYFAILSLVRIKNLKCTPKVVAERLGITDIQAGHAIKRLFQMGMLSTGKNGKWSRTEKQFTTSDGVSNSMVRKGHYDNLDLARLSLNQDELGRRDFTSVTMAVDTAQLANARKKIRKFRDFLADSLETESPDEVYRLVIQLFPLSRS